MKDKTARALAIVALVFMGIFVAALVATLVDYKLLGGSIGFIALGCGVFALMIFVALKADGRGYSITQMNNEIEMQKLEEEAERQKAEAAKKAAEQSAADNAADDCAAQSSTDCGQAKAVADAEKANAKPVENADAQSEGNGND